MQFCCTALPCQSSPPQNDTEISALKLQLSAAKGKDRYFLLLKLAKAESHLEKRSELLGDADQLARLCFGPDSLEHKEVTISLAQNYQSLNSYKEAEACWQEVLRLSDEKSELAKRQKISALSGLIAAQCAQGFCKEQISLYKSLLKLRQDVFGKSAFQSVNTEKLLAETYEKRREYTKACSHYQQCVMASTDAFLKASSELGLARCLLKQGKPKLAEAPLKHALSYAEMVHNPYDPLLAAVLKQYADFYEQTKDPKNAKQIQQRLSALRAETASNNR